MGWGVEKAPQKEGQCKPTPHAESERVGVFHFV